MLYSKKRRAQKNELRLKVLTYNLSIIARPPHKFGQRAKAASDTRLKFVQQKLE